MRQSHHLRHAGALSTEAREFVVAERTRARVRRWLVQLVRAARPAPYVMPVLVDVAVVVAAVVALAAAYAW